MAHKPGQETDAEVHRALWPDDKVLYMYDEGGRDLVPWYCKPGDAFWTLVPAYTTDLMAWDWKREGWRWMIDERTDHVMAVLLRACGSPVAIEARACYADHGDSYFQAQAFARALCVLEWAERSKTDGT